MNEVVEKLYRNGLITLNSIAEFIKSTTQDDEFIKKLLAIAGISRKPTDFDRQNVQTWRNWRFSDEMIEEAVNLSAGKNNPFAYVNAILSEWKNNNVFTVSSIPTQTTTKTTKTTAFKSQNYTKEELDDLIDNIDDVEF